MKMDNLYTVSATAVGGRDRRVKSESGILDLDLKAPKEMGGPGGATNPEELFAVGYASCFMSALSLVIRTQRIQTGDPKVKATVTLGKTPEGHFQLKVRLDVLIPGVTPEEARRLAEEAHQVCPYSRATRGNIEVDLQASAA